MPNPLLAGRAGCRVARNQGDTTPCIPHARLIMTIRRGRSSWCGKRVKEMQTELLQTRSFRFAHRRLRSVESFQVMGVADMALFASHADGIGFSARDRKKAFQTDRIDRPVFVLTVTVSLTNLEGGQHTGTVPLLQGAKKLGKLIGLALEYHDCPQLYSQGGLQNIPHLREQWMAPGVKNDNRVLCRQGHRHPRLVLLRCWRIFPARCDQ